MTNAQSQELLAQHTEQLDYLRRILLAPIYDVAVETELTPLTKLSARLDNQIFLKREDQQPVHSFKLRGAYNKLSNLSETECIHGVIAASAGNHAQGLALAANKLGIKATIVMPKTTPDIKVDNVRRFGAEVRLVGHSFNEAQAASVEYAKAENKTIIHPFDDIDVIAGQGTVAKELLQQQPNADVVFIPVGGGGLLAGMAVYLKQLSPKTKVIVEYLNAVRPHAEGLIQAMEAIQQNKNPMAVIDKMALDSLALIGEACTVTTATRAAAAKKYGDKDD